MTAKDRSISIAKTENRRNKTKSQVSAVFYIIQIIIILLLKHSRMSS